MPFLFPMEEEALALLELVVQAGGEIDASVLPARAADGKDDEMAPVMKSRGIGQMGRFEGHLHELFGQGIFFDVGTDRLIEAGKRAKRLDPIRIPDHPGIEDDVGVKREAVLEAEALEKDGRALFPDEGSEALLEFDDVDEGAGALAGSIGEGAARAADVHVLDLGVFADVVEEDGARAVVTEALELLVVRVRVGLGEVF